MNETNAWTAALESPEALAEELERVNEKLDRLMNAIGLLDRRRDDVEEMLADVLPAANGAVRVATRHLWELEQRGTLHLARETADAIGAATQSIDPDDVRALGANAGQAVRALRNLTGPDVTMASQRAVEALQHARTGRPPSFFSLWRRLRQPHVRRGIGAALEFMESLGEGAHPGMSPASPVSAAIPQPAAIRQPAAAPPVTRRVAAHTTAAPASAPVPTSLTTGGGTVSLDADGFLTDPADWSREVAEAMADHVGIGTLTDEHWRVLDFCRTDAQGGGSAPGLRRITKELDIPPGDMYRLFPKGPGTLAARLAGLKKPKSCV
ncbi:MAG: TusE/DsrC/DsvC family sulfur relay protein [Gemmatimonadetes bacterium]|nr:TusE/DsrC/DsvC family sulfur relay protein [Gemmatimonadota bacterium]